MMRNLLKSYFHELGSRKVAIGIDWFPYCTKGTDHRQWRRTRSGLPVKGFVDVALVDENDDLLIIQILSDLGRKLESRDI